MSIKKSISVRSWLKKAIRFDLISWLKFEEGLNWNRKKR